MAKLTPRERRHQKTKQAILDAARDIINKRGVDSLSLREIANRIDYSPAGLYEYFDSKDEIIAAVCIEGFERFGAYLGRVPADLPPSERLSQLGMAYLDFAQGNPEYFLLIFTSIIPNETSFAEWADSNTPYHILQQAVQAIVDADGIELPAGLTVDDLAYVFWSQVHGMAMLQRTVFCKYDYSFDEVHRWVFEVWDRGLKAK